MKSSSPEPPNGVSPSDCFGISHPLWLQLLLSPVNCARPGTTAFFMGLAAFVGACQQCCNNQEHNSEVLADVIVAACSHLVPGAEQTLLQPRAVSQCHCHSGHSQCHCKAREGQKNTATLASSRKQKKRFIAGVGTFL